MGGGSKNRKPRRRAKLAAAFIGVLFVGFLGAMVSWPVINDVETGKTPEYPDVQVQTLRFSPDLVFERAVETIDGLSMWSLSEADPESGVITAIRTTRVFRFKDDITVTVSAHGEGSLVNVRSKSRVGRSDFGQNARNILAFQAALEENLQLATSVAE